MVCENCACLADNATLYGPSPDNNHLNGGVFGTGLKCLYPQSCTCQHKPVGKYTREDN